MPMMMYRVIKDKLVQAGDLEFGKKETLIMEKLELENLVWVQSFEVIKILTILKEV